MTRRDILLLATTAVTPNPHKDMADAGNAFHTLWRQWADDVNSTPSGGISASGILLAQRMDKLYKEFQRKRKLWEDTY